MHVEFQFRNQNGENSRLGKDSPIVEWLWAIVFVYLYSWYACKLMAIYFSTPRRQPLLLFVDNGLSWIPRTGFCP